MTPRASGAGSDVFGLVRVRFIGGPLSGAVLDLPAYLAESDPRRLVVTSSGVFDRRRDCRPVAGARVVRLPVSVREIVTAQPRPALL